MSQNGLYITQSSVIPTNRNYACEAACLANCNFQGWAGHLINTYGGNLTHQQVDLSIPVHGLPLTFERSYNALDLDVGPLGQGWTHNYNMHLNVDGSAVILVAPHGSRLRFT